MSKGPLAGIRIIGLDQAMAGGTCTSILGDLGAEVIKVEAPLVGDIMRRTRGPNLGGESFHYLAFNRSKKSVVLNLITPAGREVLYDLVRISDVVVDNFRPGVMERLGADYQSLKKVNPKIITCSISGYGATGPHKGRPAFDVVALGLSGVLSTTGEVGHPPMRPSTPLADFAGSMYATVGILAALVRRLQTAEGSTVDVSLLDAAMASLGYLFSYFFLSGVVPKPQGRFHEGLVPYGIFKTKDRYITVGASWPRIARVVGEDWMIDEPRFATAEGRLEHKEEINQTIEKALGKATAESWLELFRVEDIPGDLVKTLDEVVEDPQVVARNMVISLKHPNGELKMVGNPIKMESIDEEGFQPPPLMGQHTLEVLSSLLGYSEKKVEKVMAEMEAHAEEAKSRVIKLL